MAANENALTQPKFELGISHTQCVSGKLDHKTDFQKNCWKKINYFPGEGGGGGGTPPWKIPLKYFFFVKPSLTKCFEYFSSLAFSLSLGLQHHIGFSKVLSGK